MKTVSLPENSQRGSADRLPSLIREHRQEWQSRGKCKNISIEAARNEPKTKITVIAWNSTHNALGRGYLLADVLRNDYDVELIAPSFPRFGDGVWEPLRNCSRVTIKDFPGGEFPEYFKRMEDIAEQIEGDIIYVSKPRLPSLELAILAKLNRNRPIILDVDDYELGFFRNRGPLTLEALKTKRQKSDFNCPHHETWTRYSETLIPLFDQLTVSNEELRKKFGGMVLPHIRDEHDFDPTPYPRDEIRAEFGFSPEDKVVLFIGTTRMHKGVIRIAVALEKLNRPGYKFLVIGSLVDDKSRRFFNNVDPMHVKLVSNVPFSDIPAYLRVGDLICLLQDSKEVTAQFQMPAKFTDGLAMAIPMLASNVPNLANLAKEGLVELLENMPLEKKIHEIFSNYEMYKRKAIHNRVVYLQRYSYGANLPKLRDMIEHLLDNPTPVPEAFRELVAYHHETFANMGDFPRVTAKVVASAA